MGAVRRRIMREDYEASLKEMAEEYKTCDEEGKCFVHIRKRHSSNKGLRILSSLTQGAKFYKVNLDGNEVESILTNSHRIAG